MTNPVGVLAMAGALTVVPAPPTGLASGPAPRSSSEHAAPTLGFRLSLAGTQRAASQSEPAPHAPDGDSVAVIEIETLFLLPTSTSTQPVASTPQSSPFATAA